MLTRSPAPSAARVMMWTTGRPAASDARDCLTGRRMIGHGQYQSGLSRLCRSNSRRNRPRVGLVYKGAVNPDGGVERSVDPLEGAGQSPKEGCFRPHQDHLDPENPSMHLRQSLRIVELPRGGDHLCRGCGTYAATSVQDALHGRRAHASQHGNIKEGRLRHRSSPQGATASMLGRLGRHRGRGRGGRDRDAAVPARHRACLEGHGLRRRAGPDGRAEDRRLVHGRGDSKSTL